MNDPAHLIGCCIAKAGVRDSSNDAIAVLFSSGVGGMAVEKVAAR